MKMLVMEVVGLGIERLLRDEELTGLRRLAASGCFARFEPAALADDWPEDAICAQVARAGGQCVHTDQDDEEGQEQLEVACHAVEAGGWDYMQLSVAQVTGEAADYGIARILEALDDDTALLVLLGADPGTNDGFILAAPGYFGPPGELRDVTMSDLVLTLLHMAGFERPEGMEGQSLIAGPAPAVADASADDEEAAVRARLEGLGYIG